MANKSKKKGAVPSKGKKELVPKDNGKAGAKKGKKG
jgi:hypothetical protein